jgi:putative membrane protein insertion efficiency factor
MMRFLLLLWRNTIGRVLPDACRFTPSCSHYAVEALQRRGPIVGTWMAVRRILRCHPLNPGGYDPVLPSSPPCTARGANAQPS